MKREVPKELSPRLRVPEFREGKGWARVSLTSVLSEDKIKSDGKAEVHSVSLTKGVVSQVEHMGRSFSAADTSHYSLVKPFDVVYTKSPLAIFKLGIVKQHRGSHNALVSPLYGVFTPANRHIGQLIEAYFDSPSRSLRFLDPLAQKGAKNTIQISNERFLSGELFLPSDEREQKKIADCLGSLDDLIAAEGRKLEALRQHKQGLIQQLFPQPGETVPPLRFPEFRNAVVWKTKILGTQGSFLSSLTGKAAKDFDTGDAAFIPYMNVFSNAFTNTTDLRSVNVADDESQSAVAKGDVFFTVSSETPEEAGMSSVLLEEIGNCYLNSFCALFRFDEGKSPDPVFLGYLLRSATAREHLSRGAQGATRYNISRATFRSLPILISSGPEQKKIADCLGPLDDLIATEGRKLDSLRQNKRGLMQQLFPSLEGY